MIIYSRARMLLACAFIMCLFSPSRVRGGEVTLAWNASVSPTTAGYDVYFGMESGVYIWNFDAGTNLAETITGLTPGLTYYFATTGYDTNGDESPLSNEVTNTIPIPPSGNAQ